MDDQKRRERHAEHQRTYARKNPERRRKSNDRYYAQNKEAIAKRQKAYREEKVHGEAAALVKEHRKSLGMSQQKYASALGVTQATLSLWERGIVPVNLETLSRAFPELGESLRKEQEYAKTYKTEPEAR